MKRTPLIAVLATSLALLGVAAPAHADPPPACGPASPGGPFVVDATCADPAYTTPVIDTATDVASPVPAHLVTGHFEGTSLTFKIYLPPAEQWEGRFFQFTYPTPGQDPVDSVAFGASHGGYTVQTSSTGGYRHLAAAAKFARTVAADYYGVTAESIFGYVYGWSGGSYQVIGAIENTFDVWQGAVPIVQGIETSIPNNFAIRGLAGFVLADQKEEIVAALSPGGSGDPYLTLTDLQRDVLTEATRMGIPLPAWEYFDYVASTTSLQGFGQSVRAIDPSYVVDFWNDPRYLGAEQSDLGQFFRDALAVNDTLNRRWELAMLAYHRYQLPTRSGFAAYDQYRAADGTPLYPQRPFVFSKVIASAVSGGAQFSGAITGKVIAVEGLFDFDAFPWHGAWYGDQVRASLGAQGAADSYRLYFTDNATHNPFTSPESAASLVGYMPVVFQALDDLAAWTEDGVAPPRSSNYDLTDGQITLPDNAANRRGIQPVVDLAVGGDGDAVSVDAGASVGFQATIQVPPHAGSIVSVEWDPEGDGVFEAVDFRAGSTLVLKLTASYPTAGAYNPVIRVGSQRDGDAGDTFTVIHNLDRVHVSVN